MDDFISIVFIHLLVTSTLLLRFFFIFPDSNSPHYDLLLAESNKFVTLTNGWKKEKTRVFDAFESFLMQFYTISSHDAFESFQCSLNAWT